MQFRIRGTGRTVPLFFSSHVLSEIGRHCHRAGILRDGKLIREDTVDRLIGKSVKRVSLRGVSSLPEIEGMKDLKQNESNISVLYSGRADELIEMLSKLHFEDVTLTDPDIEDVFIHYYSKEGE